MRRFTSFKDKLLKGYLIVGSVAIVILTLSTFIQVITRYILSSPPSWTEELARYMFVWATFLGAAVALDKGLHATITVLDEKLSPRARNVLKSVTTLFVLGLSILICAESIRLCLSTMSRPSPVMKIPMACVNVSLFFSGIGMVVSSVDTLLSLWKKPGEINAKEEHA